MFVFSTPYICPTWELTALQYISFKLNVPFIMDWGLPKQFRVCMRIYCSDKTSLTSRWRKAFFFIALNQTAKRNKVYQHNFTLCRRNNPSYKHNYVWSSFIHEPQQISCAIVLFLMMITDDELTTRPVSSSRDPLCSVLLPWTSAKWRWGACKCCKLNAVIFKNAVKLRSLFKKDVTFGEGMHGVILWFVASL